MADNIRKIAIAFIIFLLSPVTVLLGLFFLGGNKLFITSILLVVYSLFVFFLLYEGKKPSARSIVIVAVLIAVAVVGRAIFFFAPNFKPVLAIVILSGVGLGKENGFVVGTMAAFVSNFIFGQGPWTPWQMIAMGVIGFLAGVIFNNYTVRVAARERSKKVYILLLCIYGFLSTFIIYAALVDLWTIFGMLGEPTLKGALLVYGTALPFNTIHSISTVFFIAILGIPFMEKLTRLKTKYGLL